MSLQFIDGNSSNAFEAKRQCLIEQYNEFLDPETSQRLDGKRTVIENIADNSGITLAYRAYRTWSEKFGAEQQELIGLDYTRDQLFWLSAAQTWCGVYRQGLKLFNAF
jgi:neprilysin